VAFDSAVIDRIVAGVLAQLGEAGVRAVAGGTSEGVRRRDEAPRVASPDLRAIELTERIVTAETLESVPADVQAVLVPPQAIVTPAARDVAALRGLRIDRAGQSAAVPAAGRPALTTQPSPRSSLLIEVRHTEAVDRVWEDLRARWRRELLGCPDDAAALAIAEVARGAATTVVILAEQTHRAACLANRHERVKGVVLQEASDVAAVRRQLRANVWCLDPAGKSWFELKRLFSALETGH
jgi:hypothetical protein